MRMRWWIAGLFLGCISASGQAATPAQLAAAQHWQALARGDVEAAYQLLERNHPGAVTALGDTEFRKQFEAGHRLALRRAGEVGGLPGYVATMLGFANSLKDEHIWFRGAYGPASVQWPGLVASKKGSRWLIAETDESQQAFKGAEIVSCDGKAPGEIGRERIGGFRADWDVEAQQVMRAPLLLVDDGNPFVTRPASCVLRTASGSQAVQLKWRDIARPQLQPIVASAAGIGHAGYGVSPFAGGTWIALEGLGGKAPAVLEAVEANLGEIRKSPLVVVDMRGNGGGNSEYGHRLATQLLGAPYVSAVMNAAGTDCPSVWRVSPDNIQTLVKYRAEFGPTLGEDYVRELDREIATAKRALARGQQLSGPIGCRSGTSESEARKLPAWPVGFKLVLLTDSACFSSCLLVTDELRRLGAVHVGQATNAATRYMEVREVQLPSGLGTFSTLQKADLGSPAKVGPFEPKYRFDGDIADTEAVKKWVAATVTR
jgi:hypothetical protein